MIVKRKPLNLFERLYLPAIIGGFKVTLRHLFKKKVTMQYPEEKWVVPEGYRGAPYLVKDQEGSTKCVSCQLCEFVCPPKAIKITPPGPAGQLADRPNAEKMPKEFESLRIPKQRYAVFMHRGHISTISQTMQAIWQNGIVAADLKPADSASFERYDERFNPATGEGDVEVWMALED